jgi:hypothetical protein
MAPMRYRIKLPGNAFADTVKSLVLKGYACGGPL